MSTPQQPRVGFLGLGAMGSRMVLRIRQAGYPLTVWNRSPKAAEPLRAAGVPVAGSVAEVARQSDVLFTMLFDDAAVTSVLTGADGVLASASPGATVINVSTVAPATARALHAAARARSVDYLDAPVSGSTPQAEQGQLVFLVGGEAAVFERSQSLLLTMGKAAERFGDVGAGSTAKLAINAMLAVGVQALAEGLALAERGGLDRARFLDTLGQTAAASPGQKAKFANAVNDQFPPAFALQTIAKDLRLIAALAAQLNLPMPATAAAQAAVDRAVPAHGNEDFSVLIRTARR